jgi:hypothetical protein
MASFTVYGPFVIGTTKMKVGRAITKENIKAFWDELPDFVDECGCYLFGFRAAKGSKPVYVGKATVGFKKECFTDHKLKKYSQGLANQAKGTPIMYFVALDPSTGPVNKTAIDEAETFLIQSGLIANPKLLNDRKVKSESWSIGGVVRSKGKASTAANDLKRFLKL